MRRVYCNDPGSWERTEEGVTGHAGKERARFISCEFLCFTFTDAQKGTESETEGVTWDEPKHKMTSCGQGGDRDPQEAARQLMPTTHRLETFCQYHVSH